MANEVTPRLVLIGADKGGVGKTTVARALLGYCDQKKIAYRVIDTEAGENSLRRFHPAAEPIDMARVAGQMRIFDALGETRLTIVDIRAGLLTVALKAMEHAEVFEDVKAGKLSLAVFHVVDANVASLEEMAPIAAHLPDKCIHVVVKNQPGEERFSGEDAESYRRYFKHLGVEKVIDVPHLEDLAAKAVDREGVPFRDFATNLNPPAGGRSEWLRKLVNVWQGQVWKQFDAAGVESIIH